MRREDYPAAPNAPPQIANDLEIPPTAHFPPAQEEPKPIPNVKSHPRPTPLLIEFPPRPLKPANAFFVPRKSLGDLRESERKDLGPLGSTRPRREPMPPPFFPTSTTALRPIHPRCTAPPSPPPPHRDSWLALHRPTPPPSAEFSPRATPYPAPKEDVPPTTMASSLFPLIGPTHAENVEPSPAPPPPLDPPPPHSDDAPARWPISHFFPNILGSGQ